MALAPGTRLGPYEVGARIGAGGMGEVYRARDANLGRDVAIKVLPDAFAQDPERLARFEREAKTLASLNHPNIAIIHGLEQTDGVRALVMELVDGPTLADRIAQGPIPLDEALPIAKQIAEALEAAHEHGIIHRDLKPANIKVRDDASVKVLDFGLAKALDSTSAAIDATQSPTITSPAMVTGLGVLLGTAAYMSPEQAKGRRVDKRSDIWAFGCVLYEMLTGKRAFEGEDVSDTLAVVLRGAPDWSAIPSQVSPTLLLYVRRCLARDPAQRVHDIADVRLALEGAFDVPAQRVPATPPVELRKRPWWLIAAGTGVVTAAAAVFGGIGAPILFPARPPSVVRLTATPPNGVIPTLSDPDIAVSDDGTRIAYVTSEQNTTALYVRSLDQLEAIRIAGVTAPRSPFFSPDGQSIGFFDGGVLKRVSARGGPAVAVTSVKLARGGASWGADDSIIFATGEVTGLLRVAAKGGETTVLTKPNPGEDHVFPQLLPGNRGVLFTIYALGRGVSSAQVAILDLESGTQKVLLSGASYGKYASSGHLVYGFAGTLRAVGFDLDTLTIRGNTVPVLERVVTKTTGAANFAISADGSLVYESGDVGGAERALVWVDRNGREEPILGAPKRAYTYPRISPDGTRVALDVRDQENDIWLWDVTRQNLERLTLDPGLNRGVIWMPDGKTLVFSSERDGMDSLFSQPADGSGPPKPLMDAEPGRSQFPSSLDPEGARLVFFETGRTNYDLGMLQLGAERKAVPLLNSSYNELNGEVSPNGRWLAFQSNESGTQEIYVRPFPNVGDGRVKVSTGGGTRPAWARNGRELFYLKLDGTMVAVAIKPDARGSFSAGTPTSLFPNPYFMGQIGRTYDVSPDGSRFLMIKSAAPTTSSPAPQLWIVQHWFEELKRLVPTK